MIRRKSPAQRLIAGILALTMLVWSVGPTAILMAQPVTVPALNAPAFQQTDFDPYFAAAAQSSSEAGWEQTVAQAKAVLAAQWEIQAEIELQNHLSAVTQSDAFNTVSEYRDYLRKELEIQKQVSRSQWELAAEVAVASSRDSFLTSLVNRQAEAARQEGQSYISAGTTAANSGELAQLEAARQEYDATFDATVNQSLQEYNVALGQIQAEAQAFLLELQQADQQFQTNLQAIETYENQVRTGIQNATDQLRLQLQNNSMFYAESCDAENVCTTDMGQMTAAGQTLQDLLNSLDTGLASDVPLSTLAGQLTNYLQNRETAAITERDTWEAAIYEDRNLRQPNRPGFGLDFAAYQALDPLTHSVLQFLRFSSTAELNAQLDAGHRVATDFTNVDIFGHSLVYDPYPVTAAVNRTGQGWVANGVGHGALTFDALGCGGPPLICLWNPLAPFGADGFGEKLVDVQVDYRLYDANAEANRDTYQQYVDDISFQYNEWNGTLMPALQNWETQVATYEANYAAWQTERVSLEQQNLQAFQEKRDAILADRNQYLSQLASTYQAGIAEFDRLERQLLASAATAQTQASGSQAASSTSSAFSNGTGGVDAALILANGLQNAAGYAAAAANKSVSANQILQKAESQVTKPVDREFLERWDPKGPRLDVPPKFLESFYSNPGRRL